MNIPIQIGRLRMTNAPAPPNPSLYRLAQIVENHLRRDTEKAILAMLERMTDEQIEELKREMEEA